MRIGIIGIGGVGGYFGGKLAREYGQLGTYEIIFIARGEHLQEIKKTVCGFSRGKVIML